ncbi:unnamed protein product [Anisakis simplex]|uniref:Hyaluronidase n=1 Tax=Anisakis simplex TaxID=6269 RepID=A0A0M3JJA3_ANISI|nr:unnamed protein product [Anisakis simplex]
MVAERICLWCSIFLYYLESASSISVYWNVPTRVCIKRGIDLELSRYGIRTNADERFYGNEVVTFYEGKIGLYPLYNVNQNATYTINHGLPQVSSIVRSRATNSP